MYRKIRRKDFLKLSALGGLGLYLEACNGNNEKKVEQAQQQPVTGLTSQTQTKAKPSENVTYYRKNDKEYQELRQGFNKRIDKYPAVIAVCKNTEGVREAILFAKENKLPVAVKSGGHCTEGFSVNDDGLVINLSQLNTIENLPNGMIKIGPACRLEQLYDTLLPQKRVIPSGSCGSVAIGGLTLGGGYGLLSRRYGLTCDNLVEVTMVDGEGNIRNSKDDKDLLWACKGGGNGNFGVVTEMKFKTHPAPEYLQSHRLKAFKLDAGKAKKLLEQWFLVTAKLPVSCFSAFVLNGRNLTILITDFEKHNKEVEEIIDSIAPLADKKSVGLPISFPNAIKIYFGIQYPIYFRNSSAGLYNNFGDVAPYIEKVLDIVVNTPGMIYQVNTLGGNIQNKKFEEASAFAHRRFNYLSELQTYWDAPSQEKNLAEKFKSVQDVFNSNGISAQYCNYPYLDFQNWNTAYYGSNYPRLQQLKNKYDPSNIISHEQSIKNSAS